MWALDKKKKSDKVFLFYVCFLTLLGLIILSSASSAYGYKNFQDAYYFVKGQLLRGIIPGIVLFLICAKIDYKKWSNLGKYLYFFTIALLVLVFIPGIGAHYDQGAHSWLNFYVFSFQPAELAKLALIIVLAKKLSEKECDIKDWKNGLLPIMTSVAPLLALVALQPDIGTLSVMCAITFLMLVMAGLDFKTGAILGLGAVLVFGVLILIAPYRMHRMTVFLHPELDPQKIGYHINQAYLAVGSGGLWGEGYGHSRQKYLYLPEVQADSVFAIYAEEMGFVFSVALVMVFLLCALRGMKISREAPDDFGRLIVGGVMIWFFMQSFLNMAAMVGGSPLTGVPLPFISHGGSAMMMMLAAMGIVLNVSRNK